MTTGTAGRPSKGLLGDAAAAAANAARRAAVTVRPLETLGDMERACAVLNAVWGIGQDEVSEVQPHLLRALGHAGNYLVGAYTAGGGDRMVGASVGFFAEPLGAAMHSHITGVLPARAGSGVGAAIKWHQRQWALERGLTRIGWTFDPLIARNSFFNLTRLGARAETYFVDFYGAMNDGPNRGQPSDRIHVVWDLAAVDVLDAQQSVIDETPGPAGPVIAAGTPALLAPDAAGAPVPATDPRPAGALAAIGIPADIEAMRRSAPELALRWRYALREALALCLADRSWRVVGFTRTGWYLLQRSGSAEAGGTPAAGVEGHR